MDLGSRIKIENGLKDRQFGQRFRLCDLTEEELAKDGGADPVAIEVKDPDGVSGDVGALEGRGAGG